MNGSYKFMVERIPQRIDHYRYTDKGVTLDGVITRKESAKDLPRLSKSVINNMGDIEYHLQFDIDAVGNRIVTGAIKAQMELQCQRCMGNYAIDLNCEVAIAFVHNEFDQKKAEDSCYEVFWLDKKEFFDPRVLIEDELLLALPQIPMHPESETGLSCKVQLQYPAEEMSSPGLIENDLDQEGLHKKSGQLDENNPFAVLKQLKNK